MPGMYEIYVRWFDCPTEIKTSGQGVPFRLKKLALIVYFYKNLFGILYSILMKNYSPCYI